MSSHKLQLEVDGQEVNVFVHQEMRKNSRVSLGKTGVHIRVPRFLATKEKQEQIGKFLDWAETKLRQRPDFYKRKQQDYVNGQQLLLQNRTLTIHIDETGNMTSTAELINNQIFLDISYLMSETEQQKAIKHLLSRCLAREFYAAFWNRLHELNNLYFQKEIKTLKLKYTSSRWGSCSNSGNINLSTRLLFAPQQVVDYVMIHELAHLIHPNHSRNFWNCVEQAMPEYKEMEQWLKAHGSECDF